MQLRVLVWHSIEKYLFCCPEVFVMPQLSMGGSKESKISRAFNRGGTEYYRSTVNHNSASQSWTSVTSGMSKTADGAFQGWFIVRWCIMSSSSRKMRLAEESFQSGCVVAEVLGVRSKQPEKILNPSQISIKNISIINSIIRARAKNRNRKLARDWPHEHTHTYYHAKKNQMALFHVLYKNIARSAMRTYYVYWTCDMWFQGSGDSSGEMTL